MAMGARYFEMQGWTEGAFVDWIRLNVVMMNPPGHTRLRQLVSRAFTPRAVLSMRDVSERVAGELCDMVDRSRRHGRVRPRVGEGHAAAGDLRDDRDPDAST